MDLNAGLQAFPGTFGRRRPATGSPAFFALRPSRTLFSPRRVPPFTLENLTESDHRRFFLSIDILAEKLQNLGSYQLSKTKAGPTETVAFQNANERDLTLLCARFLKKIAHLFIPSRLFPS
jgi:hypothetical protein